MGSRALIFALLVTAALFFRQLRDGLVQFVHLNPLKYSFFHALPAFDSPPVQCFFRHIGMLIVPVHLVQIGNVLQFKAVKGVEERLVDLNTTPCSAAVYKE